MVDEWSFSWASSRLLLRRLKWRSTLSFSKQGPVYFDLCLIFLLLRFSLKKDSLLHDQSNAKERKMLLL